MIEIPAVLNHSQRDRHKVDTATLCTVPVGGGRVDWAALSHARDARVRP